MERFCGGEKPHSYEIVVVWDDWATGNMDPCSTNQISHAAPPIRSTTQIWIVIRHRLFCQATHKLEKQKHDKLTDLRARWIDRISEQERME